MIFNQERSKAGLSFKVKSKNDKRPIILIFSKKMVEEHGKLVSASLYNRFFFFQHSLCIIFY